MKKRRYNNRITFFSAKFLFIISLGYGINLAFKYHQLEILTTNLYPLFGQKSHLNKIIQRKTLRIGIVPSVISTNISAHKASYLHNLDVELSKYYADSLGINLVLIMEKNYQDLFHSLDIGKIDIAASGKLLCVQQGFLPTTAYHNLPQQLVYKNKIYKEQDINKISDNVVISDFSPQYIHLTKWKQQYPNLNFNILTNKTQEELIRQVAQKKFSYTIADAETVSRLQRFYPKISIIANLEETYSLSWCMKTKWDKSLWRSADNYTNLNMKNGFIDKLTAKYMDHLKDFDYVDTAYFLWAIKNILPKYEKLFKTHAKKNDLDWHLIAAIAYQESHWNPTAVSKTGVKGIMMLTQQTAEQLNITDRTSPTQSIRGGTAYLRHLLNRIPKTIPDDERILFALAAYNIGLGHIYDARKLTEQFGDDKNSWSQVKKYLPLLHKKEHYTKLKYGRANGLQTIDFVKSVQQYKISLIGYLLENENINSIKKRNNNIKK